MPLWSSWSVKNLISPLKFFFIISSRRRHKFSSFSVFIKFACSRSFEPFLASVWSLGFQKGLNIFVKTWSYLDHTWKWLISVVFLKVFWTFNSFKNERFVNFVFCSRSLLCLNHRIINKRCSKSCLFDNPSNILSLKFDFVMPRSDFLFKFLHDLGSESVSLSR